MVAERAKGAIEPAGVGGIVARILGWRNSSKARGRGRQCRPPESHLDACLGTDEEFAAGPTAWANYNDPFPEWNDAALAEE
jgi:hypothetical protein